MKIIAKRVLSLFLMVTMLISCTNLSWAAQAFSMGKSGTTETLTDGQIIAGNYTFLNDKEKAIISCTALKGGRYDISYPTDDDGLIEIDPATKSITAKDYNDGELVWKPVSAKVTYKKGDGTDGAIPFQLTNGSGTFSCPADTYRIEVEYELDVEIDSDLQAELINAPSYIVDALINFNWLNANRSNLGGTLNDIFDGLYSIRAMISSSSAEYAAIIDMHDNERENGYSKLYNMLVGYYNSTNKTQYVLNNAAAVKAENERVCANLEVICKDDSEVNKGIQLILGNQALFGSDNVAKAELAQKGLNLMKNDMLDGGMLDVKNDSWTILDHDLLTNAPSAEELAALNTAVLAAISKNFNSTVSAHSASEVKNPLKVASTTISAGVDQYKVNVTVNAEVIAKTSVSSNETITLPEVKKLELVLDKGTSAENISAEIEESGIKAAAISSWDPYYEIGEQNYDVVVTGLTDKLEGNINVVITYLPKEYKITYVYGGEETVKYGYNLLLPAHTDETKSYDYTVNGSLQRENTTCRIVSDTEISRKEGKAIDKYRVPVVIANSFSFASELTTEEKNILKALALKEENIWYRVPSQDLGLVNVISENIEGVAHYVLTADDYASGLSSGAVWKAVSVSLIGDDKDVVKTFDITDGELKFPCGDTFDHIEVAYEIEITDVDKADIEKWMSLPANLVSEAAAQREAMAQLATDDLRDKLAQVYGSRLSLIKSMANGYSDEAKAAIAALIEEGGAVDYSAEGEPLYLYEYLTNYNVGGLSYYYEDRVYENIARQVELLADNLRIIWDEPQFRTDLENNLPQYVTTFQSILETLEAVELVPANDLIDRDSDYLASLVNAIDAANGKTSAHVVSDGLVVRTAITAAAPDRASLTIVYQVVNGKGNVISSESENRTFSLGMPLEDSDIALINAMVATLEGKLTVDNAHYTVSADKSLPVAGDELAGALIITYTWSPVKYTVKINGEETDISFFADAALAVNLPGCADTSLKYRYTIGTDTVDVATNAYKYTFADLAAVDALADAEHCINITRETVDVYTEKLLTTVNDLNRAIANSGLTFDMNGQKCLMAGFILAQNPVDGTYSIVLRVSPAGVSADITTVLTEIASALASAGFKYIGLNNEAFWDGQQVYLQSAIDMVLNSEFGFKTICDVIGPDGNIKEMTDLEGCDIVGADAADAIVISGKYIPHASLLGGKILSSNMQLGDNAQDCKKVNFYVTLEDFDLRASALNKLENAIVKVQSYIDINCKDGKLCIDARMPESLYPYYVGALTLAGKANVENITDIDLEDSLGYDIDLVRDLFADGNFTTDTIERTLEKAGKTYDLEAFKSIFGKIRPAVNYILNNANVEGTTAGSTYSGNASMKIREPLMSGLGLSDTLLNFIAEASVSSYGINADFALKIKNMDNDYSALVVDYKASGLKKVSFTNDLTAALANAGQNTVVILLSDSQLTSDVTINNRVIIDLNGKTLNGNIKSTLSGGKNSVFIVDTTIGTFDAGTLDGTLTAVNNGSFTITGGKFTSDVSAMLKEGYAQDANGYVSNALYTVKKDANGDVSIILSPDFLKVDNLPSIKALAVDIAADAVANVYNAAGLTINGETVYEMNFEDVLEYLSTPRSQIANDVLGCIDTAGVTNFCNTFLSDVTDFAALSNAVKNGNALVSYPVTVKNWDLDLSVTGPASSNYIKADIVAGSDAKNYKVNIFIDSNATSEQKSHLTSLLDNLDKVVEINALEVALNWVKVENGSFKYDGMGNIDVTFDLAQDKDYAVVIATVVAYSANADYKAELVDAVASYLENGSTSLLKKALDKVTTADIINAIKKMRTTEYADMLTALGLDCPSAALLEASYDEFADIAAIGLNYLGITGNSQKLGGAEKSYGVYSASKHVSKYDLDIKVTVKLFGEEKAIVVKDTLGKVVYETDDLANALANATDGCIIYVNAPVELANDVELSASVEIVGCDNITFSAQIKLTNPAVKLTTDKAITATVVSGLTSYSVVETKVGNKYEYTLAADAVLTPDIELIKADGTVVEYSADNLADALENAANGDTVKINVPVTLSRNVSISSDVTIENAAKITLGGKKITLANTDACVTADADLGKSNFVSGVSYFEVKETVSGTTRKYSLSALDPAISDPSIYRLTKDVIAGSKVTDKYIYLDVRPEGITATQVLDLEYIKFTTMNADKKEVTLKSENGINRTGNALVCTGDVITVKATNTLANKSVEVKYTIIILGDTNCNGLIDSGDATRMALHYTEIKKMSGAALLAADTNCNGSIDSGDAVKNATKYTSKWANKTYTSDLK